jgi:hypothetical protein
VSSHVDIVLPSMSMIHLLILAVHLLATIAKLVRPGGVRAVVAESLLLKHQLVISSRARRRAPNLNSFDRFGQPPPAHAALGHYAWRHHCHGLFQMSIAA